MNKEIAKILRERLSFDDGLPFVQKYAGLVQVVETTEIGENGTKIKKRFPVKTEEIIVADCKAHEEIMTPDSSLKGILYFEDGGTTPMGRKGSRFLYSSNLTLICWINRAKVVSNIYSEITGIAIQKIIEKMRVDENPENVSMFTGMTVSVVRILPQEASIFSKYTYDETITQFLRPPFEFFALGLQVKYGINSDCVEPLTITTEEVCY